VAVYQYKGLDGAGAAVSGIIDAESSKSARTKLRKQRVFPTDIWEKGGGQGKGLSMEVDLSKFFDRLSVKDVAAMTSQLSTLVGAGIPIVEALTALIEQVDKPKMESTLRDIREQVNQGTTLADAMRKHPDVFPDLYVNMVAAGEASGALEIVLIRLTEYTESQVRMQGQLLTALTYPALMGGVSALIIVGLFVGVIPRIKSIFDSFGATLPLITRVVVGISDFTLGYWYLILMAIIAFGVGFFYWVKTPAGRRRWHSWMLSWPILGNVNRKVAVSRFCRTMSTLMDSGVPILSALEIVKTIVGNEIIADAVGAATRNISEGQSIAAPLKESGQFPPIVTHMIAIGEKTGELEPMLAKVADSYDQEVERTLQALTSILEPIMIVVMGGIVATVALAILLPMLTMSSIAN
jgi:general secretion pathway protein F